MTSRLFLIIGISAAVIPAAVAVALSERAATLYTEVLQPGILLLSCPLAVWVARMYRKDLRWAFIFLSVFLLSYGFANITPLTDKMAATLGGNFLTVLWIWQVFTYLMLLLACLSILRAIGLKRLHAWALLVMALTLLLAAGIIANGLGSFSEQFKVLPRGAMLLLLIRVFDALVLLMLVPVLLLYVQNARAKYQESSTFSVIVLSIIASLVFVYVYEVVKGASITQIATVEFHKGSVLDGLYIFLYLTIAVGLYAHRKHQDWSLKQLDQVLAVGGG